MGDDDSWSRSDIWLVQYFDRYITDSRRGFRKSLCLRTQLEERERDDEQRQKQKKFIARVCHIDAFVAAGFLKCIPVAECLSNMTLL